MADTGALSLALGAYPETDFCGKGRIQVVRHGRYHPVHLFQFGGETIAELRWQGPRRVGYTVTDSDIQYDMKVGHMQRKIRAVDHDGRGSRIAVRSNRNYIRRRMYIQMGNGDNFLVSRSETERWGGNRLSVRKQHYVNSLLVFHFDPSEPAAPILVDVERLMKWEISHFHMLLALISARITLEHRWTATR
ncbi:MAG: hypothetical protein IPF53_09900 [Blastocatellia bacterium]|nr:hypothetical protein [Blastocatellia bacterium]MBK6424932.1 hypothetical protein [Blastocatellia bacterium]